MKDIHLAIILDGNRRFAKKLIKEPWKGHVLGSQKLEKLIQWCLKDKIKELTLYCFSLENFNRPKKEFDFLMNLFKKEAKKLKKDPRLKKHKIKINFIGKKELLNPELQQLITEIEAQTKNNSNFAINFAIAYGGRQEIIQAIKNLIKSKKEINEQNFKENLWLSNEPDLIIRTGGEKRTSNFLPWQSTYSEWIFLDKMWPEFIEEDFQNCLAEFKDRKRRFGK